MAALNEDTTELVRGAMIAAKRHDAVVSFDCNYRSSLWKARGGRQGSIAVNRSLMEHVDVLFGHEGACGGDAGREPARACVAHAGQLWADGRARGCGVSVGQGIASTVRRPHASNRNGWGAFGYAQGQAYAATSFEELEILDRVGGGDLFAAGLIYGLLAGKGLGGRWSAVWRMGRWR